MRILVCGAGGFIAGHLVASLIPEHEVRAVDIKPLDKWFQKSEVENLSLDLRIRENCQKAVQGVDMIYNLAADMGGIGFITKEPALCTLSVLINANLLWAATDEGVRKYFYSSSACVYRKDIQQSLDVVPLREEDCYPALPDSAYGWEKLYSEIMCQSFSEDHGIDAKIARFHNVYGPYGSWKDGREKAPAAICRKVAEAKKTGNHKIQVWGDGQQLRSYMHIQDCLQGIKLLCDSNIQEPINLGSSEAISLNELIEAVEEVAEIKVRREYDLSQPVGVRGRNSDNTKILKLLGWQPTTSIKSGIKDVYHWIWEQMNA